MIRGLEVGDIIPFSVWIILFPVLKINFEPFGTNERHFCKRGFLIRGLQVGEIIPFPVWIIPFPLLKMDFENLRTNEKYLVKEV